MNIYTSEPTRSDKEASPLPAFIDGGTSTPWGKRRRANFVQLQALVTVVLSYQLLFGADPGLSQPLMLTAILGMLALCGFLMVLPIRFIGMDWFPVALGVVDAVITTFLI